MKLKITIPLTRNIPEKTRFVAQDADGQWGTYSSKPRLNDDSEWGGAAWISNIAKGIPNPDWKDTLIEIKSATVDQP